MSTQHTLHDELLVCPLVRVILFCVSCYTMCLFDIAIDVSYIVIVLVNPPSHNPYSLVDVFKIASRRKWVRESCLCGLDAAVDHKSVATPNSFVSAPPSLPATSPLTLLRSSIFLVACSQVHTTQQAVKSMRYFICIEVECLSCTAPHTASSV